MGVKVGRGVLDSGDGGREAGREDLGVGGSGAWSESDVLISSGSSSTMLSADS